MKRERPARLMVMVLVAVLTAGIAHVASAQVITDIERRNSSNTAPQIAGPLVEDALVCVPSMFCNLEV